MSLVFLRTADGRFLAGGAEPESPLRVDPERQDSFAWDDSDEAADPTLRSLVTGRLLFHASRMADGAVVLRSADDGQYVSIAAGDGGVTRVPDAAGATEVTPEPLAANEHGCCGLRSVDGPQPAWKKASHRNAMEWARKILTRELSSHAALFHDYWDLMPFQYAVTQGLEDADFKDPWMGTTPFPGFRAYENHFYDPDSHTSHDGKEWTALCDGRRYFNLAVHDGRRLRKLSSNVRLMQSAGHRLGLSIHFLSDLTQPMHAANFANFYGAMDDRNATIRDYRHGAFEEAADAWIPGRYLDHYSHFPLTPKDVEVDGIGDSATILRQVAEEHKRIFVQSIRELAAAKKILDRNNYLYTNQWRESEMRPVLQQSLLFLPKLIAQYCAYWASRIAVETKVSHMQWYQILTGGRPIRRKDGEFILGTSGDTSADAQFCFVFNSNGSWTVVCRGALAKVWQMRDSRLFESNYTPGEERVDSQFRFAPFGPFEENSYWIFEPSKYAAGDPDVLGLEERRGPRLKQCLPNHDLSQVFRLSPVEAVTATEERFVRSKWPFFGRYQWFGSE